MYVYVYVYSCMIWYRTYCMHPLPSPVPTKYCGQSAMVGCPRLQHDSPYLPVVAQLAAPMSPMTAHG